MYSQLDMFRVHTDADGAVRHHPHRTHDIRRGSQDHHPSKMSVQKTMYCNSTSDAPDDGRMYPKHDRAKNTSIKLPCCIKLAFHEEDTWPNNPQVLYDNRGFITFSKQFYSCFQLQPEECSSVTQAICLIFSSHYNKCLLTELLHKFYIFLSQINFSVVYICKDLYTPTWC